MKFTSSGKEGINQRIVIEALLFVSEKPLFIEQIRCVLNDLDSTGIRMILEDLKAEYLNSNRAMRIIEIAGGFQMVTASQLSAYLKKFYQKTPERLSRPTLETLSIIAYKQPITRMEIENIRGVDVSGIMKSLINRGLLRIAGRKKVPGRPFVYATTRQFLEYFGLRSLDGLPKMEEFVNKAQAK
ncbi:MAG: SMC-Scp complex subunit ScpB [Candidatus Omnitrophica bacterium]|nr:SMC-Scp complex subunit ScpB [Candidatus Omnitrophota bacterium]